MIDWFAASAFAAWYANKTGLPWRLPTADEREKAGRGVDGRSLPWGDHIEPNWCCIRDSHHGEPTPQPVTAFPEDESIYGVRGLAGNVRDWCADVVDSRGRADAEGGYRLRMGAFWNATPEHIHLARRVAMPPRGRGYSLGFRLVRGLVEDDFS
jgi:serine/threonine-protein kinase